MLRCILATTLALTACKSDETAAAYGAEDQIWRLVTLDGVDFTAQASLVFDGASVRGKAPCNSYFGANTTPYPWFSVDDLGSTKMLCPQMEQETHFLSALSEMTLIEVSGATLILTDDTGRAMVFTSK